MTTRKDVIRITEEEILEHIKNSDTGRRSKIDHEAASRGGMKFDDDKLRYHLVDPFATAWLVASLTFGAKKYAEENWRNVENARERYYASLMRHLEAWRAGQDDDEESGLPHLSGVLFAAMCLTALHAPRDMVEIQRRTVAAIAKWRAKQSG